MNRIFQIFGYRNASLICTLFALINRITFAIFVSRIGRDERLQLTMAENLQKGKGLSLTKYFTTDLTIPVQDYSLHFPPGYSTFIVPFLKLFDNNIFLATTAFEVLSAIFFVFIIRLLCKKLLLPIQLVNIVTVVAGCSQYIFFMESSSADILSLDFILAGMLLSVTIVNGNKKYSFYQIAGYGFLFFLPAFFRYMYIPLVPLFPILIFCAGFFSKNKRLKTTGLQLTFTTLIFLTILAIWLMSISSKLVSPTQKGFFPAQLSVWYPFFIGSFINIDFLGMRIERMLKVSYATGYNFLMFLNFAFIPFFLFGIRSVLSKKQFNFFSIAGWTMSILILLQLAFLTVTHKPQTAWAVWNYTYEGRYYAFVNIFLVLFVFYVAALKEWKRNSLTRFFFIVSFVLIGIETAHGIYFNIKFAFNYNEMRSRLTTHHVPINYFTGLLTRVKEDFPDRDVFVSSHDSYYLNHSASKGVKTIYDPFNLNTNTLRPARSSILLFVMDSLFRERFHPYLERRKPKLDTVIGNKYFYIEELVPGSK